MGTVGLSFGSPTSGQGFDVATTVNEIIASYQAVETPWKNQIAALNAQDNAFSSIGTDLATLATKLSALTDFQGILSAKQGSSSQPSILALTSAASTATAGSHTVVVNSLAQTNSWYSTTLANGQDTLSGTLQIQVGSGTTQSFALGGSVTNLAALASSVNAANIGVTASVITDTTGSRLSIVSNTSGSAGAITVGGTVTDATTSTAISFQVGQQAQDASLTVDGAPVTSSSNTVTNAIQGVTFQLLEASPATPVQVQVTNDTNSVTSSISDFVTAYNAVAKDINIEEGNDSNGNPEPLFGNPTLALMQEQLNAAITSVSGGSSGVQTLSDLGISMNNDGTLSLNTDTLQNVLNTNYQGVVSFFQNSGSLGQNLSATLSTLNSSSSNGLLYQAIQQNTSQVNALNQNISAEESILADRKTTLTNELNQANYVLQEIPSQLNYVNEIYAAISGYVPKGQ